jgi:NAD(P)-dependent dehydrogenase (short-subunit alcohol dehydrogenase family)
MTTGKRGPALHAAQIVGKSVARSVAKSAAKSTTRLVARLALGMLATTATYLLLPRLKRQRKVVVITGGSRGLGFALAERYGRSGALLVLAARDAEELAEARRTLLQRRAVRHEDDILLVSADLADEHQASGLIASALETFGRIDILINNAGIIEVGPAEDQPLEAYRRAIETNFYAALYTIYAALPYLLARNEAAGKHAPQASIVNIASVGGKFPVPHLLPYVASKFALTGFSEGLHAELRHKGIRVTTVCPGLMRTGGEVHARFTGQADKEKTWFSIAARTPILSASVKHAANRIYHAVANGRAEITITPQAWLAARIHGLCPETTQFAASLIHHFLLPAPAGGQSPLSDTKGAFWHEDRLSQAD